MPKKILTVGFSLAGEDIEFADFTEKKSLLDWDIVLFRPDVSDFTKYRYDNSEYMGKLALNDRKSFEMREANAHWRREIAQAVEAGKLVVGFLTPPVEVFAATGTKSTSGTGRNQKVTRHVEQITNYDCLPVTSRWTATQGTAMALAAGARNLLAPYWKQFGQSSQYNVVWDSNAKGVCVQTEHGQKPVGLFLKGTVSAGALLLLPDMDFIAEKFFVEDEEEGEVWSPAGEQFSASLIGEIVALSKAIASDGEKTPQPEWASADEFALAPEIELRQQLLQTETELEKAQRAKEELSRQLEDAGQLRALLFEKGKPLEAAIITALKVLGFKAEPYEDGKSEFDAVFDSAEGRLLGEAEGKDNKAVNIEKLRQLSTNLHEDLQREEVHQLAKGILFGNGYRLTKPGERETQFTDKCITSATSMSYGLVSTDRLYAAAQYLSGTSDEEFARRCRVAMIEMSGIVRFPDVPVTAGEAAGGIQVAESIFD
ncbi:hypothetical protein ACQZ61_19930 [Agrobacterium vitis]|uniref:hypothetical protein n=1 Tax=Agrobacterium vitis TaxID=373 RepID=UPI001F246130|nr:hypothetical protein [Agrobacterium vitis]